MYELNVCVLPNKRQINVSGKVTEIPNGCFYLNESFQIHAITVQGKPIPWFVSKKRERLPYDPVSVKINLPTKPSDIFIEYTGEITSSILDVNYISEDAIELGSYAGWYPKIEGHTGHLSYHIRLELPSGYHGVFNGHDISESHVIVKGEALDLSLFASKSLIKTIFSKNNINMIFIHSKTSQAVVEKQYQQLLVSYSLFIERYGEPTNSSHDFYYIYAPREGWGYQRGNTTFLPGELMTSEQDNHGLFHELAHAWWSIASREDDWINEMGAEYSAYCAALIHYDKVYCTNYLRDSREAVRQTKEKKSIIETSPDSPDRYTNLYLKPTLMLLEAEALFGEEKVKDLLYLFYQRHRKSRAATTKDFLSCCDIEMASYFRERLYNEWH